MFQFFWRAVMSSGVEEIAHHFQEDVPPKSRRPPFSGRVWLGACALRLLPYLIVYLVLRKQYTRNWLRICWRLLERTCMFFLAHPMSSYEIPFSRDLICLPFSREIKKQFSRGSRVCTLESGMPPPKGAIYTGIQSCFFVQGTVATSQANHCWHASIEIFQPRIYIELVLSCNIQRFACIAFVPCSIW